MTARWSGEWGVAASRGPAPIEVLIPTVGRIAELAVTLAGLAAQTDVDFDVLVSDQSDDAAGISSPTFESMVRVLRAQGRGVRVVRHLPRRGLAEHRQFLLESSTADEVLFLDDDVWLEPGSIARMHDALGRLGCGFVGLAPQGLSFLEDERPQEWTSFTPWGERVEPEHVRVDTPEHDRWALHSAANLVHLAREHPVEPGSWSAYRIAWLGACVLYRRSSLVEVGGFDFWDRLPEVHVGEDVAAQWRVLERFGGAGLLPSGAVHLEAPTTLPDRSIEVRDVVFAGPSDQEQA